MVPTSIIRPKKSTTRQAEPMYCWSTLMLKYPEFGLGLKTTDFKLLSSKPTPEMLTIKVSEFEQNDAKEFYSKTIISPDAPEPHRMTIALVPCPDIIAPPLTCQAYELFGF